MAFPHPHLHNFYPTFRKTVALILRNHFCEDYFMNVTDDYRTEFIFTGWFDCGIAEMPPLHRWQLIETLSSSAYFDGILLDFHRFKGFQWPQCQGGGTLLTQIYWLPAYCRALRTVFTLYHRYIDLKFVRLNFFSPLKQALII